AGAAISERDYAATRRKQAEYRELFAHAMRGLDALVTPTTETAAPSLKDIDEETLPSRFTRFVNYFDLCALAIPAGFSIDGLPLSLQIVCRGFNEHLALAIGRAFQDHTNFHRRVPRGLEGRSFGRPDRLFRFP